MAQRSSGARHALPAAQARLQVQLGTRQPSVAPRRPQWLHFISLPRLMAASTLRSVPWLVSNTWRGGRRAGAAKFGAGWVEGPGCGKQSNTLGLGIAAVMAPRCTTDQGRLQRPGCAHTSGLHNAHRRCTNSSSAAGFLASRMGPSSGPRFTAAAAGCEQSAQLECSIVNAFAIKPWSLRSHGRRPYSRQAARIKIVCLAHCPVRLWCSKVMPVLVAVHYKASCQAQLQGPRESCARRRTACCALLLAALSGRAVFQ